MIPAAEARPTRRIDRLVNRFVVFWVFAGPVATLYWAVATGGWTNRADYDERMLYLKMGLEVLWPSLLALVCSERELRFRFLWLLVVYAVFVLGPWIVFLFIESPVWNW